MGLEDVVALVLEAVVVLVALVVQEDQCLEAQVAPVDQVVQCLEVQAALSLARLVM